MAVISEFDLSCAECGAPLDRTTVSPNGVGFELSEPISVAECPQCGGRYYPESTLERL